ncbi:substrate-binding domain-containing protein [Thermoanaerobacter wiegelii]|uniref:Transcriptional regulator, LacI family n=1 Tax=Thermoanaerobacter wiegelii Rt8.B1 TaxID=697303 RepID=G2MUY7_9THEO|nr:substrate-binding domain-containing protein [Thermoanaerobacter wiegelii]AEM77888.1 transcriptional regulator, LacI family [Thermoanaerobacter wiegelii Rt8.B1]
MNICEHVLSNNKKNDYINSANEKGVYDAINYLIQNGHKKIGFIGNNEWSYSFKKRYQAYIMYMEEFKIQIDEKFVWLDINLKGPNFLEDMDYFKKKIDVNDTDFPTAWICANDKIALAFMRSLSELNIKVPEDVSVIGFDNIDISTISYPALTTINVPKQQLGVKAIQQLLYRLESPTKIYEDIKLSTNLVIRNSVKSIT